MLADFLRGFVHSLVAVAILFAIAAVGSWFSDSAEKGVQLGTMLIFGIAFLAILSACMGQPKR